MKKLLTFLLLIALIPAAAALQVSAPTLGGNDAQKDTDVSATFTITNNDDVVVTDIAVTSNANARYQITFENVPSSLGPGASQTVTVRGYIPSDFSGRQKIGRISVTANKTPPEGSGAFGSHDFQPDEQTPSASIPVEMSARSDCGQDVGANTWPKVGDWHAGTCNFVPDIEINVNGEMEGVDAGWVRINAENKDNYFASPINNACGGTQPSGPPQGWVDGGSIMAGPGKCDGSTELPGFDAGWVGLFSDPSAEGKLLFVVAHDKCGGSPESVPENSVTLGRVRTGQNKCDGNTEAISHTGRELDAGAMYVVFKPNTGSDDPEEDPVDAIGEVEELDWTSLKGWAYDADAPTVSVQVFVDGQFWREFDANEPRNDLVAEGTIPDANHGFSHTFTASELAQWTESESHEFSFFAVDVASDGSQAESRELAESPKTLPARSDGGSDNGGDDGSDNGNDNGGDDGDSGNDNGDDNGEDDGNSGGSGGNQDLTVSASADLFMEVAEVLSIDRVKINCDHLESVDENEKIEVRPGDSCVVTVRVENLHNEIDLEDVRVEVDPENSDADGESERISRLRADDREEVELDVLIDDDAEDEDIDVTIRVTAQDEDNNDYEEEFEFTLEVERLEHELEITRILANPDEARRCIDSSIEVSVYVENIGSRDEDEAAVEVSIPSLGFIKKETGVRIDEGEERRVRFTVPITSSSPFGSFSTTVKAFYENVGLSDQRSTTVKVLKCGSESDDAAVTVNARSPSAPEPARRAEPIVILPDDDKKERQESRVTINTPESEDVASGQNTVLTGVLIVLNIIALAVLGVMSAAYVKKRKDAQEKEAQSAFESQNATENAYSESHPQDEYY